MKLIYKYEFNGQTYTVRPDAKALTTDENGGMVIGEDTYQTVLGMTDEEAAACHAEGLLNQLRCKRDYLLQETDWWANSDLTMTQAQIDYRQALRDITKTYTSLEDAVFPEKP
jgi:hypothetical protein